jgi:hypothetical protein
MAKLKNSKALGRLALPVKLSRPIGAAKAGLEFAMETAEGNVIQAGVTFPLEIYSASRLAEFNRHNDHALAGFRFKKRPRG